MDLRPAIRLLQRELALVWRRVQRLRAGPGRDALQSQRRDLRSRIQALREQQRGRAGQLQEIRREIASLQRRAQTIFRQRRRVEARRSAAQRALPYGLIHPGALRGQELGRLTGRLRDLRPQPPWAELVVARAGQGR
jgi:septal ring factor EnvC (AmiA/AmiB activator)